MVFQSPDWVPKLPFDPPDDCTLEQFMHSEKYGRSKISKSNSPFTCGISGRTFTTVEMIQRTNYLSRALSKRLGFKPNDGTEWNKVIGIFALNTVDNLTLALAVHRLGGVVSPANAAYSGPELEYQMKSSGAKAIFTCIPLLDLTLKTAKSLGIPEDRVFVLDMPEAFTGGKTSAHKTVEQLIQEGSQLPDVGSVKFGPGDGAKRTAFLCYSSGTSGLPKGVMISHQNVLTNVLAMAVYESVQRKGRQDIALGLLPFSHIYGLVVVSLSTLYRGDGVIVLPKFELEAFCKAIQDHKINVLYIVPPIIISLIRQQNICKKFDLSSVKSIFTGAAPLGAETATDLQKLYPSWKIRQGYGLTETCTVVSSTSEADICFGTSGSLVPGTRAKLMSIDGVEITGYGQPGELIVQSKSVVLGYLNNDAANKETFLDDTDGGGKWMRTGDEAIFTKAPGSGNEHLTITERIKELIKVKGLQVAPAELEAHLLSHPYVGDCAVIPVPDDQAGEVPKAYVVKSNSIGLEENDRLVKRAISKHVEEHKARHKWLKGGIEFIDVIPKSPSGKILRRLLRDREKEARKRTKGAKL